MNRIPRPALRRSSPNRYIAAMAKKSGKKAAKKAATKKPSKKTTTKKTSKKSTAKKAVKKPPSTKKKSNRPPVSLSEDVAKRLDRILSTPPKEISKGELMELLERSIEKWNVYRARFPTFNPDISGIVLAGHDLSGANLNGVDASHAVFDRARLVGADLSDANLQDADLEYANVETCNFRGADLTNASLKGASGLQSANWSEAILEGTTLELAQLPSDVLMGVLKLKTDGEGDPTTISEPQSDTNELSISPDELQIRLDMHESRIEEREGELKKATDQFDKARTAFTDERASIESSIEQLNKVLEATRSSLEAQKQQTTEDLARIREEGIATIATLEPVRYWETKANQHLKDYKLLTKRVQKAVVIGSLTGVGLWLLVGLLPSTDVGEGIAALFGGYARASLLIIYAAIFAFILRTLTKQMLSERHLYHDAEERRVMIMAYLAFLREGSVEPSDRAMMLQAIFRGSATGLLKEEAGATLPVVPAIEQSVPQKKAD